MYMNEFLRKFQNRSARVGVIGQGYVGLPLALAFREAGFHVTGFDLDPVKVAPIARGESYIKHIGSGAEVRYCDPCFPVAHPTRKYHLTMSSVPLDPAVFASFDAIVVSTAHDVFRNEALYREVKLVVDTRNVIAPMRRDYGPRVVKA
jgi:UDP-N-acetyl-D-mannosaminuronate dehydrogenase